MISDLFLFLILLPIGSFLGRDSFDALFFFNFLTNSSNCSFCSYIVFFLSPDLNFFLDSECSLEHDLDFLLFYLYNFVSWLKSVGFVRACSWVEKKFLFCWLLFVVVDGPTTAYSVWSLLLALKDWFVLCLAALKLIYLTCPEDCFWWVRCSKAPFSS